LLGSEAGVITAHFPSRCSLSLAALGFCGATYITGWRVKSEILTRQWAHVDFHSGWLRPGETKNAEGRQFPLTPALRAVLERQRERTLVVEKATRTIIPGCSTAPAGPRARRPVIPLAQATRTKRVSPSTVRVGRARRRRSDRAARAKSLPAGEKTMVGWDGIERQTRGFSDLGPCSCKLA